MALEPAATETQVTETAKNGSEAPPETPAKFIEVSLSDEDEETPAPSGNIDQTAASEQIPVTATVDANPPIANTSEGRVLVWSWGFEGDEHVLHVLATVVGEYAEHGDNHGRKVYKKLQCDHDAFIYYWDERDGPAGIGWWFGSIVGGDETWSHSAATCVGLEPPVTGWKIPFDGVVCDTLVTVPRLSAPEPLPAISLAELDAGKIFASPLPPLPQIKRLRVSLLGGNSGVQGLAKSEVASALLRGLTANWPSDRDPVLDLQFESGVFEAAWSKLLVEDPKASTSERWGVGPVGAWVNKVRFEKKGAWKQSPPFESDCTDDTAMVYGGNPQKLNIGNEKSTGATRIFRDALATGTSGKLDPGDLENVHKELYAAAKAHPREVVWKLSPCLGVSAAFARFLPELEDLHGCGAVVFEIFEKEFRPMGNEHNIALVYASPPNNKAHSQLTAADILSSLWAIGHNIAQTVREYNKLADGEVPIREPPSRERALFLRAAIESHIALKSSMEVLCKDERALGLPGWMNIDVLMSVPRIVGAGVSSRNEIIDALTMSKTLETKLGEEGTAFIRVEGIDFPPEYYFVPEPEPMIPPSDGYDAQPPAFDAQHFKSPPAVPPVMTPPSMTPPNMTPPPFMQMPGFGVIPPWMAQGFARPEFSPPDRPPPETVEPPAKRMAMAVDPGGIDLDKVCWNFAKGSCLKGTACRWGHILPPGYTGPSADQRAAWRPRSAIQTVIPTVVSTGFAPEPTKSPIPDDVAETYSSSPPSGGSRVRIVGLASRPTFNNRIAVCKNYDAAASRWEIQLEDGSILRVQEKNLRVIEEEGYFSLNGPQLAIGERVRITGLSSKPGYNNRAALCKSFDRSLSQWVVLLDDGSTLLVPEVNLFPY